VVDEASFDFRELPDAAAEAALEKFNESLDALRDDRQMPAVCSLYAYVECRDGMELHNLLYSRATEVDPDVCRRTGLLLDRCPAWDDDAPAGCEPLDLPETPIAAFSVGFAFLMALSSRAVGCLVVPSCPRRDFRRLSRESSAADVLFFADAPEARRVWRHAYAVEDVAEREFFAVATFAFPSLVFHPGLRFGRFEPEVFTQIFMIMVSKGVGTTKGAPELGEYGLLRTVSVPRKGHLSGGGYKESTQGGGSRVGLVGEVVG